MIIIFLFVLLHTFGSSPSLLKYALFEQVFNISISTLSPTERKNVHCTEIKICMNTSIS